MEPNPRAVQSDSWLAAEILLYAYVISRIKDSLLELPMYHAFIILFSRFTSLPVRWMLLLFFKHSWLIFHSAWYTYINIRISIYTYNQTISLLFHRRESIHTSCDLRKIKVPFFFFSLSLFHPLPLYSTFSYVRIFCKVVWDSCPPALHVNAEYCTWIKTDYYYPFFFFPWATRHRAHIIGSILTSFSYIEMLLFFYTDFFLLDLCSFPFHPSTIDAS